MTRTLPALMLGAALTAAAAPAALAGLHQAMADSPARLVHQLPGAAIGQARLARGGRQGALLLNRTQQPNLARAYRTLRPIQAKPQLQRLGGHRDWPKPAASNAARASGPSR